MAKLKPEIVTDRVNSDPEEVSSNFRLFIRKIGGIWRLAIFSPYNQRILARNYGVKCHVSKVHSEVVLFSPVISRTVTERVSAFISIPRG